MDKDPSGYFRVDDFIKVYLEAEDVLRQKIAKTIEFLEEYQQQKNEAMEKLAQLQKEEKLNAYGIMHGSILTIHVLELQDIFPSSNKNVYVKISVEQNTFQTNDVPYQGKALWNEQFNA